MSENNNKEKLTGLSSGLMELFVSDVFKKNNVTDEKKRSLTDEQKQKIKEVVEDLKNQVDNFLAGNGKKVTEEAVAEKVEDVKTTSLRDKVRKKLLDK
ncbi:spore coat protein [Cytobacillus suaedae]|nr:spore coat protein [Cytobacillus suaedae]